MDGSENSGFSLQSIHFSRVFHDKTIHFGVPLFLETPLWSFVKCTFQGPSPQGLPEAQSGHMWVFVHDGFY